MSKKFRGGCYLNHERFARAGQRIYHPFSRAFGDSGTARSLGFRLVLSEESHLRPKPRNRA